MSGVKGTRNGEVPRTRWKSDDHCRENGAEGEGEKHRVFFSDGRARDVGVSLPHRVKLTQSRRFFLDRGKFGEKGGERRARVTPARL